MTPCTLPITGSCELKKRDLSSLSSYCISVVFSVANRSAFGIGCVGEKGRWSVPAATGPVSTSSGGNFWRPSSEVHQASFSYGAFTKCSATVFIMKLHWKKPLHTYLTKGKYTESSLGNTKSLCVVVWGFFREWGFVSSNFIITFWVCAV